MTRKSQIIITINVILLISLIAFSPMIKGEDHTEKKNHSWMQNSYWFQGEAEINYYDASINKYGIPRDADQFVHIVVTEKHKPETLVKANDWRKEGLVDMLKFNYVRSIQTGIYRYHEMMGIFFDQRHLQLTKMTFTSQEWCGQSFKELVNFDNKQSYVYNTYWEGQASGSFDVSFPEDLYLYDALPVQLRMFTLSPDRQYKIELLPGQISSQVKKPEIHEATVSILQQETITAPAGTFQCYPVEVSHSKGTDKYWLESDFPHRMVRWVAHNGDQAELIESQNLAYWDLNNPEGAKYLPEMP